MSSLYERTEGAWQKPTTWSGQPEAVEPAAQPPTAEQQKSVVGTDDPWESVKTMAENAAEIVGKESELAQAFEQRRTLARRLADAYRRRDDKMAGETAQAWIRSELKIAKIFERYEKHVRDRNDLLRAVAQAQT